MTTATLARETAARLLANLDEISDRDRIVVDMLDQVDGGDDRLQAMGAIIAHLLDTLVAIADSTPEASDVITTQTTALALNRAERRALRRGH